MTKLPNLRSIGITRVEIIDYTATNKEEFPRVFTKWVDAPFLVELDLQDENRTLKIFLDDKPKKENQ